MMTVMVIAIYMEVYAMMQMTIQLATAQVRTHALHADPNTNVWVSEVIVLGII